jgi:hypothetical protein
MSDHPTPAERAHLAAVLALVCIVGWVILALSGTWMIVPHLVFFVVAPFLIALGFWLAALWTPKLRQGR